MSFQKLRTAPLSLQYIVLCIVFSNVLFVNLKILYPLLGKTLLWYIDGSHKNHWFEQCEQAVTEFIQSDRKI